MITRQITDELLQSASEYPVVTVLGPRQSGKTTLARQTFPDIPYFSLEDPDTRMTAESDPRTFLAQCDGGGILDEIQNLPILLSYIQGIVDEARRKGHFILTGSHQPRLGEAVSQSLAGRTAILDLWPFSFSELRHYNPQWDPFDLIANGCYPRLHEEGLKPGQYYRDYVRTYVQRDVRTLTQLPDLAQFQRFLVLLAGRVGQVVNYTSLSNDLGVTSTTIKSWVSVLTASYIVFELSPFFMNVRKRVVKSPKIYFTDPGLAAFLLGIRTGQQASRDPLCGGLYENLIITGVIKDALNRGVLPDVYFFRDSNGVEVDLLIREGGRLIPIEIKSGMTFTPAFLKGLKRFRNVTDDRVTDGFVLYNGDREFTIHGTRVFNPLPVGDLWETLTAQPKE